MANQGFFGPKVSITRSVSLHLTARDWQLFSSEPGAEDAAKEINTRLSAIFSATPIHTDLPLDQLNAVFREFRHFGATDTEPRWVFFDLVKHIYGEGVSL